MGLIGELVRLARDTVDGEHVTDVTVDLSQNDTRAAHHYAPAGDDSRPLPGDLVALSPSSEGGTVHALGYLDRRNESQADDGEVRRYARAQSGTPVAEVWLKKSGDIVIRPLTAGGLVHLGKSDADEPALLGNQFAATWAAHVHPTPFGPSGTPSPLPADHFSATARF